MITSTEANQHQMDRPLAMDSENCRTITSTARCHESSVEVPAVRRSPITTTVFRPQNTISSQTRRLLMTYVLGERRCAFHLVLLAVLLAVPRISAADPEADARPDPRDQKLAQAAALLA